MRLLPVILAVIVAGCATSSPENFYTEFEGQEEVTIVLDTYGLEALPEGIAALYTTTSLRVFPETFANEWRVYPPQSVLVTRDRDFTPPFHLLPPSITELENLQELAISKLNIHTLPENFGNLRNLRYLDISFNKLNISQELPKLKSLPNLKKLLLFGNEVDTVELNNWKTENPELVVNF